MEHQFNVELATKLGVEKAVIIHNMYYWINHNAKNNKNVYDSSVWTYNSASAFGKLFPYIKDRTISRYLLELERDGYIKTGNYSDNIFDKTKWYSFTDNFLEELKNLGFDIENILLSQNVHIDTHKMANRTTESGEPITDSKQEDVKQEEKEEIDKSISKKKTAYNANADLSYVDAPYAAIWQEWLDYKKEIKKQYKTQRGAESQYKVLIKYANNNPILANAIVKISIEHSWDGIFPLSDKQMAFFLSPKSPYAVEEKGYESQTNATIPPYESKSVPTNKIPNGLTKEQYDMYISNGYTIANDGILLKDGVFYK